MKKLKTATIAVTCVLAAEVILGCIGYFKVNSYKKSIEAFSAEQTSYVQQLAEAKELEKIDEQTNCYNIEAFKEIFEQKVNEMDSDSQMALINVSFGSATNGLKFINDTYGHLYGNQTVKDFAAILKNVYSGDNYICGYNGGSNFYVLALDAKDTDMLLEKGQEFKALWHDTPLVLGDNVAALENMALHISISLIPKDGTDFTELKPLLGANKDRLREIDSFGCSFISE